MSLNRFELNDVSDLKILDKLVLKFLMFLRVSQEYGVLQLSYYIKLLGILIQRVK